jgi:hypothetical protein
MRNLLRAVLRNDLFCDIAARRLSTTDLDQATLPISVRVISMPVILTHCFRPIANRLDDERTYITPSDKAGVAINSSPIEFVAT